MSRLSPYAKAELQAILPDPARLQLEAIDEKYEWDSQHQVHAKADAVALVQNTAEVSALLAWASRHQIPVTPRGAGTNLTGSTLPIQGGLVLDLSLMNKIEEPDLKTMSITVQPGVLLEDLQAFVEARGAFYQPDPGEKKATIAGNIATNAGGMRAVKYGVTRDYVRELEVVLAGGDVVRLGAKTVKDASGLALKEALIGSEGTLGIITQAVLRLVPKPAVSKSVLLAFETLKEAAACVPVVLASAVQPAALEFMKRSVVEIGEAFLDVRYPHPQAGSYLLLTLDGTESQVQEELAILEKLAAENQAIGWTVLDDEKQAREIWQVRGALCTAVESVSIQEPIDIVVPLDAIEEFVRFVEELEKESGVQMVSFGHAGDGNIHLCIVKGALSDEAWQKKLAGILDALYEKAYALQGLASGEHGIGLQKRSYFLHHSDGRNVALMNGIKDVFDPQHLLNEGKSYVKSGRIPVRSETGRNPAGRETEGVYA